jgi:hypothetical protein
MELGGPKIFRFKASNLDWGGMTNVACVVSVWRPWCLVALCRSSASLCFLFGFPYFSRSTSWTSTSSVRRYPRMMASVNQLALALASSTQELTLALANLRFDFTLFKFEAPAEFAALGAALTPARRKAAEVENVTSRLENLGLFSKISSLQFLTLSRLTAFAHPRSRSLKSSILRIANRMGHFRNMWDSMEPVSGPAQRLEIAPLQFIFLPAC